MSIEIHSSSNQNVYIPVADIHPTQGPQNLSTMTVEVSIPTVGVAPSVWVTCSWAQDTKRIGDVRYYVVTMDMDDFTIADGTTYQPWIRIDGQSIIKAGDTIKAVNT